MSSPSGADEWANDVRLAAKFAAEARDAKADRDAYKEAHDNALASWDVDRKNLTAARDAARATLARIAAAFGCKPSDDDDLVEAVRLLVEERDAALASQRPAIKCSACSQPATRRDAEDVADVCDEHGEASDEQKRDREKQMRRMAEREEV